LHSLTCLTTRVSSTVHNPFFSPHGT
jgi:hypothetical protein